MRGADARSIVKRIVLIKFHEQVAMDLVSVTVSGGYKPLYQDEWTRVPRMSSERLADDLSRRTLLMPATFCRASILYIGGKLQASSFKLQAASCGVVAHMKVKKFLIKENMAFIANAAQDGRQLKLDEARRLVHKSCVARSTART